MVSRSFFLRFLEKRERVFLCVGRLTGAGHEATDFFDYGFAENGLIAYRAGKVLASQSFIGWLGEEKYKTMVKFILGYISQLDLPIMRCVSSLPSSIVRES